MAEELPVFEVGKCVKLKSTYTGASDKCLKQIRDKNTGVVTDLPESQEYVRIANILDAAKESLYRKIELDIVNCPARHAAPVVAAGPVEIDPASTVLKNSLAIAMSSLESNISKASDILTALAKAREIQRGINNKLPKGNPEAARKMTLCDGLTKTVGILLANLRDNNTTGGGLMANHGAKVRFSGSIKISYKSLIDDIEKNTTNLALTITAAKTKLDENKYLGLILSEFKGGKRKTKRSKQARNRRTTRVNARR